MFWRGGSIRAVSYGGRHGEVGEICHLTHKCSRSDPQIEPVLAHYKDGQLVAVTHRNGRRILYKVEEMNNGDEESFYEANILLTRPQAPFKFYDPQRPVFTHERFLPPSHLRSCTVRESIVADGCFLDECAIEGSVIGIRTHVGRGTRITRSVLLGADSYFDGIARPDEDRRVDTASADIGAESDGPPMLGIGRDVVLDRVIIDKNAVVSDGARLINQAGVQHADGDGYYIRNGVIVVPKDGIIKPGTVV